MLNNSFSLTQDLLLSPELIRPTPTESSGVPEIDNSEIRKIVNDVANAAKYSYASMAANPEQEVREGSLEATFKQAFSSMKEERRSQIQSKARDLVNASLKVRETIFGRYGKFGSSEFVSMGFDRASEALTNLNINRKLLGYKVPQITIPQELGQMTREGFLIPTDRLPGNFTDFESAYENATATVQNPDVYNAEKMEAIWGEKHVGDPFASYDLTSDFEEQAVTDKLSFYITKVKCVDETDPERFIWNISDEISIAAVTVNESGYTETISEKKVGEGFDDGDEKVYSPHWNFKTFNLRSGGSLWPKNYSVTLLLAEKEYGGLSGVLGAVYKSVREKVREEIIKWVKDLFDDGEADGKLADVIAKAVAKAVDILFGWIIDLFSDDIFPPKVLNMRIPTMSARWYYPNGRWGKPTSSLNRAYFSGHNGYYYVEYYWKLQA